MDVVTIFLCFILLLLLFLSIRSMGSSSKCFHRYNVRTLVITAHPDDESMFFAPAILTLHQYKCPVILLCLSQGNYYGCGSERVKELDKAREILGIDHLEVINDHELQDDPNCNWPVNLVSDYIIEYVTKYRIQRIISFDGHGVSGHENHCSIYKSLSETLDSLKDVEVYCLQSVNILRKYISMIDMFTATQERFHIISSIQHWLKAMVALRAHNSQMVWFRLLYMVTSRYMMVNTFTRIK